MNYLLKIIKQQKPIFIFLSFIAMLRATHEISKFRFTMTWLPIWDYPFIKEIPLDSYHFYGGLFTLLLIIAISISFKEYFYKWYEWILIIISQFFIYFYIFDLFYHIIFMKSEFMQFKYLVPLLPLFVR